MWNGCRRKVLAGGCLAATFQSETRHLVSCWERWSFADVRGWVAVPLIANRRRQGTMIGGEWQNQASLRDARRRLALHSVG